MTPCAVFHRACGGVARHQRGSGNAVCQLTAASDAHGRRADARKTLDAAIGQSIKTRRRMLGLSQTALGEAIGVTFQQIQKYERGANRISFSRLVQIAHALGCRVHDLIGDLESGGAPNPQFKRDTAHLRQDGARQLLEAYVETPPPMRKLILTLTREIVRAHPD